MLWFIHLKENKFRNMNGGRTIETRQSVLPNDNEEAPIRLIEKKETRKSYPITVKLDLLNLADRHERRYVKITKGIDHSLLYPVTGNIKGVHNLKLSNLNVKKTNYFIVPKQYCLSKLKKILFRKSIECVWQ